MQIELDLGGHCIQTSAKQAYERMLKRYLKKDVSDEDALILEKQIEGVIFFLKYADFSELRATYADLDGRRRHRVVLSVPRQVAEMKLQWDDQAVAPPWKQHPNEKTNKNEALF
jgi:hypothetical protein